MLTQKRPELRREPDAGRFEGTLKLLEPGGEVAPPVAKRLVWLSEARHDRRGVVDRKCHNADTGQTLGERLPVREHEFARSLAAVRAYVAAVGIRLEEKGLDKYGNTAMTRSRSWWAK
jgi:hypothetical protein